MYRSVALSSPVKGQRLAKTQEVRVKQVTLTYFYATQVIFQSQVMHAAEPFCSISLLIEQPNYIGDCTTRRGSPSADMYTGKILM